MDEEQKTAVKVLVLELSDKTNLLEAAGYQNEAAIISMVLSAIASDVCGASTKSEANDAKAYIHHVSQLSRMHPFSRTICEVVKEHQPKPTFKTYNA